MPALLVLALALIGATTGNTNAGDWPDILGTQRNGIAQGDLLPAHWPSAGPKTVWARDVGSGFAGPTASGNFVILFHRVGGNERIEAFSAATGQTLWKTEFPASYRGTINPDDGPRCVPVIHDGAVYAYGAAGDLYCVSLKDGAKRWTRQLLADYDAAEGYFGAGSTPIVMGDRILINVGGRDGAGLVAVRLADGTTIWKSTDESASYASPTRAVRNRREYAVFVTRLKALVVDPATGKIAAETPFGQRGPTVNAATPIVIDDSVFLTASYGVGAKRLRLTPEGFQEMWSSDEALSSQYNTPVLYAGCLYGIHGREDVGVAALRCVDAASGKVKWSEEDFGVAHAILAGDKLLLAKINGEVVLAQASPDKFQPLARAKAFSGTLRAIPALAGGKLFARDDAQLKCIAVSQGP